MDSRTRERFPSADAVDFVRFCHRRRRVGWPELYDEMCAVASRGLYRGWGADELSAEGIGFSLFELPSLAVLVGQVVAEEQERRLIAKAAAAEVRAASLELAATLPLERGSDRPAEVAAEVGPPLRFAGATAGV
jgi:hypothetical protein